MPPAKRVRRKKTKSDRDLSRFGVAIPGKLLRQFDECLAESENGNRSEAIRDLIRERLARDAWSTGKGEQTATLTLVVDTQKPEGPRRLLEARHEMGSAVLSALQLPVREAQELHVLVLHGSGGALRAHVERLLAIRGVLFGQVVAIGSQSS